ncbi:MAG: Anti-sigma F factor [Chloroflexi bacterium]|nr:Anti-sigma F factor [Chloroflexota bacterium]
MKTQDQDPVQNFTKLTELTYVIQVSEAMNQDVITVPPTLTMCEFREVLRAHSISGAPVVENGKMIGIISIEDLIKTMGACEASSSQAVNAVMDTTSVREHMTPDPETLYNDEPLANAINKFDKLNFGRFPVINRQGDLVGIITKGSIVQALLEHIHAAYSEIEVLNYPTGYFFEDIEADQFNLTLQYQVNAEDFDNAGEASSQLKKTLSHLCLHPQIIRRVAISSYEAEMNLVFWGKGGQIRVEIQPHQITLETVDTGPGIEDIEQAMQPGYSSAPEWVRSMGFGAGMGLPNIQACTDEMEIESTPGEGTHLKTTIYLENSE